MTYINLLLSVFIIGMAIFAAILLHDTFISFPKEDQQRNEWKKTLARLDEMKRKEREMFEQQSWEARKERFKAVGIV